MANKTQDLGPDLAAFLSALPPPRAEEAGALVDLFQAATGWQARLYTGGMVGFGQYDYRYDSGHSGSSLATGFAPRKAEISLYGLTAPGAEALLDRLGKHRRGKGCLYLKRLSDADPGVLTDLIRAGLADLQTRWTVQPT